MTAEMIGRHLERKCGFRPVNTDHRYARTYVNEDTGVKAFFTPDERLTIRGNSDAIRNVEVRDVRVKGRHLLLAHANPVLI